MKSHHHDVCMRASAIVYRAKMPNNLFHEYTNLYKRSFNKHFKLTLKIINKTL